MGDISPPILHGLLSDLRWSRIDNCPAEWKDGRPVLLTGSNSSYGWDGTAKPEYVVGRWCTERDRPGYWRFSWLDGADGGEYKNPTHIAALATPLP